MINGNSIKAIAIIMQIAIKKLLVIKYLWGRKTPPIKN